MENLQAGNCAGDSISVGFAFAGAALAVVTGPFGWAAGLALFSFGVSSALLIVNGDCF